MHKKITEFLIEKGIPNMTAYNMAIGILEIMVEPDEPMMAASSTALNDYLDTLPLNKQTWRVPNKIKHRVRYQAMIRSCLTQNTPGY